jgi:hypothetical protein
MGLFTIQCVRVIMAFKRVFLVWLLCQAVMGWIQYLSTCCQVCVGSCGYVPSYQAHKVTASRGPRVGNAYPLLEATRCV